MSIKAAKPKPAILNGNVSTNGKAANGSSSKAAKPKKSMYEKWIEKYGIDDSESGRLLIRAWHKTYDNHNKKVG